MADFILTPYCTPAEFWNLAVPPIQLLGSIERLPSPLIPGKISVPTPSLQPGSSARIRIGGVPHYAYTARLVCVNGGQPNERNQSNSLGLPTFEIFVDGVSQLQRQVGTQHTEALLELPEVGLLVAVKGVVKTGDEWTFTTAPSPSVEQALLVGASICNDYISGSWNLPLKKWSYSLKYENAVEARWVMICQVGWASDPKMEAYKPERLKNKTGRVPCWLEDAQAGKFKRNPEYQGSDGPTDSFPLLWRPRTRPGNFPI